MVRCLATALATLLALGAVTGCGGDEEAGDGGDSGATRTGSATVLDEEPPRTGRAAIADELESCRGQGRAKSSVSAAALAEIERICSAAEGRDLDAIRVATRDACIAVVEDTVAAGPDRAGELENCALVLLEP